MNRVPLVLHFPRALLKRAHAGPAFAKAEGDIKRRASLTRKTIVDKNGHTTTRYVRADRPEASEQRGPMPLEAYDDVRQDLDFDRTPTHRRMQEQQGDQQVFAVPGPPPKGPQRPGAPGINSGSTDGATARRYTKKRETAVPRDPAQANTFDVEVSDEELTARIAAAHRDAMLHGSVPGGIQATYDAVGPVAQLDRERVTRLFGPIYRAHAFELSLRKGDLRTATLRAQSLPAGSTPKERRAAGGAIRRAIAALHEHGFAQHGDALTLLERAEAQIARLGTPSAAPTRRAVPPRAPQGDLFAALAAPEGGLASNEPAPPKRRAFYHTGDPTIDAITDSLDTYWVEVRGRHHVLHGLDARTSCNRSVPDSAEVGPPRDPATACPDCLRAEASREAQLFEAAD